MRIILISDTHGLHSSIQIPPGDILIHAGDISSTGKIHEVAAAAQWLKSLPHRRKIVVAGNHDWLFEKNPKAAAGLMHDAGLIYLQDSSASIDGLTIYGSPWQPEFNQWAFNVPRGKLSRYWDNIPRGLDILVTHGPPYGILDQSIPGGLPKYAVASGQQHFEGSEHIGCPELLAAVERVRPRVHVFGHIHGSYGTRRIKDTVFYNASICNENYEPRNRPWVIDLSAPS
jgi:Icc-related predicted phosphoesterase